MPLARLVLGKTISQPSAKPSIKPGPMLSRLVKLQLKSGVRCPGGYCRNGIIVRRGGLAIAWAVAGPCGVESFDDNKWSILGHFDRFYSDIIGHRIQNDDSIWVLHCILECQRLR